MQPKPNSVVEQINNSLEPMAEAIGSLRQKYLGLLLILVFAIVCAAVFFMLTKGGGLAGADFVITLVSLIPSFFIYLILSYFYKRAAKRTLTEHIAVAANMEYTKGGSIPYSTVQYHKILPRADMQEQEDGFTGFYNDVHIDIQELRLTDIEQRQSGGSSTINNRSGQAARPQEYEIFHGALIRLRLRKKMEGHTIVMPRRMLQAKMRTMFSEFQPVNLVSPVWKKQYDVIATDQVEARVILNPAFMERFMEAAKIFRAKWMDVSFLDDEILFAVHRGKDLFEPPALWQPASVENMKKIAQELAIVFEIVDVLKLNKQLSF